MRYQRLAVSIFSAVLSVVFFGDGVWAQAGIGLPTTGGQTAIIGSVAFADNATAIGPSLFVDTTGPFSAGVSYTYITFDDAGSMHMHAIGGMLAYETRPHGVDSPLSVCPAVGLSYGDNEYVSTTSVQFGIGVGGTVSLEESRSGATLTPYVQPAIVVTRASAFGYSESQANFGLTAGARLAFGDFFFGGDINKIFEAGADVTLGLTVGVIFP